MLSRPFWGGDIEEWKRINCMRATEKGCQRHQNG
jgi:hypothetical protein